MNGSVIIESSKSSKDFNDMPFQRKKTSHGTTTKLKNSISEDWELISAESSRKESFDEVISESDDIKTTDNFLMSITHLAQYSILTCLPSKLSNGEVLHGREVNFYSLSPVGLARGVSEDDYMGHVFWDLEFWMLPWINIFHPKQAQYCLDYRFNTLETAKNIARDYKEEGARYAWESARTGCETCPWVDCGEKEIHVTGCIGWAIYQWLIAHATPESFINELNVKKSTEEGMIHLSLNNNVKHEYVEWYDKYGSKMLYEIAKFWNSKLVLNERRNTYDILDVMPPDEYVNKCNNSAFTNMIAVESLKAPLRILNWLKRDTIEALTNSVYDEKQYHEILQWSENSENIHLPVDEENRIVLEHEDYKIGTTVKQADVVLLDYPLMKKMPKELRNDSVDYYSEVSSNTGPAMTWTIFTICALQLEDPSKAHKFFKKNFDFIRGPFYNWTEVNQGVGATNFLTGAGGFLQSIVNGYLGQRYKLYDYVTLPSEEASGFTVRNGDSCVALLFHISTPIPSSIGFASGLTLNGVKFHERSLQIKVEYFPKVKVIAQLISGPSLRVFSSKLPVYEELLYSSKLDLSKAKNGIVLEVNSPRTILTPVSNEVTLVLLD